MDQHSWLYYNIHCDELSNGRVWCQTRQKHITKFNGQCIHHSDRSDLILTISAHVMHRLSISEVSSSLTSSGFGSRNNGLSVALPEGPTSLVGVSPPRLMSAHKVRRGNLEREVTWNASPQTRTDSVRQTLWDPTPR